MFERFTDRARRVVFVARYEAIRSGSLYIEPEHLLFALMHEQVGGSAGFPGDVLGEVRTEIEEMSPEKIYDVTSDIPVSATMKRTLSRAAEEADASKDKHIGTEHLVLGLLTEGGPKVAAILQKHGIDRESLSRSRVMTAVPAALPDRESLRSLIDRLPDAALEQAKWALERLQTWPPVRPSRIAEQ